MRWRESCDVHAGLHGGKIQIWPFGHARFFRVFTLTCLVSTPAILTVQISVTYRVLLRCSKLLV